jgi:hypothetical protein
MILHCVKTDNSQQTSCCIVPLDSLWHNTQYRAYTTDWLDLLPTIDVHLRNPMKQHPALLLLFTEWDQPGRLP